MSVPYYSSNYLTRGSSFGMQSTSSRTKTERSTNREVLHCRRMKFHRKARRVKALCAVPGLPARKEGVGVIPNEIRLPVARDGRRRASDDLLVGDNEFWDDVAFTVSSVDSVNGIRVDRGVDNEITGEMGTTTPCRDSVRAKIGKG